MTVSELIQQLSAVPQDVEVKIMYYGCCGHKVTGVEWVNWKGEDIVQITNYTEEEK